MSDTSPQSIQASTVWNRPDRGTRGPQPEHTRAEITAAAIALADGGGLSAVSMRALAGALGTAAGALYRYVASRDELLDLMTDAALAELPLDREPTSDWLEDLVMLANDQLGCYQRHPWLPEAAQRVETFGPNTTAYFEYCLRIMAPLPHAGRTKLEAIAMVTGIVSLFAASSPAQRKPVSPPRLFSVASAQVHPHLSAVLSAPSSATNPSAGSLFERIVRSVLRGLLVDDN